MIGPAILNEALERYYELHGVAENLKTMGIDDKALGEMLGDYCVDSGLEVAARVEAVDTLLVGLISGFALGAMAARLEVSEARHAPRPGR